MSNKKSSGGIQGLFASIAVPACLVVGIIIYQFIMGAPDNFDAEGHPKPGNYLAMIYMGGFIVPILLCVNFW